MKDGFFTSPAHDLRRWLLMAIISYFDRQLLRNKLSFAPSSIHILPNPNKFHKFWMSSDFGRTCAKIG